MKLNHAGHGLHRLKDPINYAEKIFAEEWEALQCPKSPVNDDCALNDIFCTFDSNGGQQPGYVSQTRATDVATIIQWLGTPVGSGWLQDVLDKIEKKRSEKRKKS